MIAELIVKLLHLGPSFRSPFGKAFGNGTVKWVYLLVGSRAHRFLLGNGFAYRRKILRLYGFGGGRCIPNLLLHLHIIVKAVAAYAILVHGDHFHGIVHFNVVLVFGKREHYPLLLCRFRLFPGLLRRFLLFSLWFGLMPWKIEGEHE